MSMNVLNSELEITGSGVQSWVWILLKPIPDSGQNSRLKWLRLWIALCNLFFFCWATSSGDLLHRKKCAKVCWVPTDLPILCRHRLCKWRPMRIQYKCMVPIYVFPEIKLLFPEQNYNVLSPSSYTHISVRDLYISRIGLLQEICGVWTDPGKIAHRHINVEIGTEAAQFPEKESIMDFSLQCSHA